MEQSFDLNDGRGHSSLFLWAGLMALLCLVGCGGAESDTTESENEDSLNSRQAVILTTFYPTQYFCERILGDSIEGIEVRCPLPADADAIFWRPSRAEISEYQKADLILINGAGFEKWVATTVLPASRLVNTAEPLAGSFIEFETTTHSHGMTGGHTHEGIDGHTWLDPENAKIQAGEILRALEAIFPAEAAEMQANFAVLVADLESLDRRFAALTEGLKSCELFAAHPAYNYLAARYGWSITNLAIDGDSTAGLADLGEGGKIFEGIGEGRRILLWEREPSAEVASELRRRFGFESVVCVPGELRSASERAAGVDYLALMRANLARLEAALR